MASSHFTNKYSLRFTFYGPERRSGSDPCLAEKINNGLEDTKLLCQRDSKMFLFKVGTALVKSNLWQMKSGSSICISLFLKQEQKAGDMIKPYMKAQSII